VAYTNSPFGTIVSRQDVEQAVLTTLQTWILTYLAEVERREGLQPQTIPPPGNTFPAGPSYPSTSDAFRGSLDFEHWEAGDLPMLIVVAQPVDDAILLGSGKYLQWFEIEVASVCHDPNDQNVARQLADWYGAAVKSLFVQPAGQNLGTRVDNEGNTVFFANRTILTEDPRTNFIDPTVREFAYSQLTIRSLIEGIVNESVGPTVVPADPYATPAAIPTVETTNVTVTAVEPGDI
jgi:hypothetical protein